jgi:hypothetical protein
LKVSSDPLLSEGWTGEWEPFSVDVCPDGEELVLVARGRLDPWTAGALLRTLAAVYEPTYRHVHVDLRALRGADGRADEVLARCRDFAAAHRSTFRVSSPVVFTDLTAAEEDSASASRASAEVALR